MNSNVKIGIRVLLVMIFLGMIIIGHQMIGKKGVGIMVMGVIGLLFVLWEYNRPYRPTSKK